MDHRIGLYAPGLNVITGGVADRVKAIDPDLVTVFNSRTERFEIYDRAAPGGPAWQMVLKVQEPDGSFRPLDSRVLRPLYEARGRSVSELLEQIERNEELLEQEQTKKARDLGEDLYEAFWAMGKRVMGYGGNSVAWQKRTDAAARERIRQEAAA